MTDHGVRVRPQKEQPSKSSGTNASGKAREADDESSTVGEGHSEVTSSRLAPLPSKASGAQPKKADKFDLLARAEAVVTDDRLPSPPPLPPSRHKPGSAMEALDNAQPPGVFFREEEQEGAPSDELADDELAAAVEEAIRLLFGVRGIHRISPGLNQAGEKVVLISVARGFDEASLKAIPATVHRFPTLVALPYELLPLRRIR